MLHLPRNECLLHQWSKPVLVTYDWSIRQFLPTSSCYVHGRKMVVKEPLTIYISTTLDKALLHGNKPTQYSRHGAQSPVTLRYVPVSQKHPSIGSVWHSSRFPCSQSEQVRKGSSSGQTHSLKVCPVGHSQANDRKRRRTTVIKTKTHLSIL